ncbi:hypothetical protein SBV1_1980010 [Verrucomicrobia bacterium]|nr:hypothetical protein SBV1_1980010 [Verrucomicrobiota bacterium]
MLRASLSMLGFQPFVRFYHSDSGQVQGEAVTWSNVAVQSTPLLQLVTPIPIYTLEAMLIVVAPTRVQVVPF